MTIPIAPRQLSHERESKPLNHLAGSIQRAPKLSLAVLLLIFSLLLVSFTVLFVYVSPQLRVGTVPSRAPAALIRIAADAKLNAYLLHCGLAFALLLILAGIYRLTHVDYVFSWTGAMAFFVALYLYLLLRGYLLTSPPGRYSDSSLPLWDGYITEMLSFGSTVLILYSAAQLLRVQIRIRDAATGGGLLLFLVLGLHSGYHRLPIPGSTALLPGGVMSLLALWAAGYGVYIRMRNLPKQRVTGTLFFVAFLIYGFAQPSIQLLNLESYTVLVTTGVYVLKALCTGFLIYLVLNETWQEKEEQRAKAEHGKYTLERILNETALGVFRTDLNGEILEVNDSEANILGTQRDHLEGSLNRFEMISDPKDRQDFRDRLDTESRVQDLQNAVTIVGGETRYLRTNCHRVNLPEFSGYEGLDRDIIVETLLHRETVREQSLRDGLNAALASSDTTFYFRAILVLVLEHSEAMDGVLLLSGRDMEAGRILLIVEATIKELEPLHGAVLEVPDDFNVQGAPAQTQRALDLVISQLSFAGEDSRATSLISIDNLDGTLAGLVLLRGGPAMLNDVGEEEILRRFLSRVAVNYPLVSRVELQRLKQGIRTVLHRPSELSDQMLKVASWLRNSLHVERLSIALRLSRDAEPSVFSSRGIGESQLHTEFSGLDERLPRQIRQAWRGSTARDLQSEVAIPILDQFHKPIGFFLLQNYRHSGSRKVSALSEIDLERLQEISESIGVVAQIWISVKNRTRLLETATHEFRSPAVAIRNTVDQLSKNWSSYSKDRIERKLEDILADSSLLITLSNNLDDSRKLPSGQKPRWVLPFKDVVFKIFRQLKPLAAKLRFEHEGSHRIPRLYLVEECLSQIMFNLISNAIKYSRRDALVVVRVEGSEEGEFFVLRVKDWGIGIPSGFEERVFEREVRAPNAVAHEVRGMGMGLSVSRDLAGQLGGSLSLTNLSNPTELTLQLPRTLADGRLREASP